MTTPAGIGDRTAPADHTVPADHPGAWVGVQSVGLDTDIGTDVDDILALALILGSPELALSGVTTVYGDVALRARMVSRVIRLAGAALPPIVPGSGAPRSGRPVWWAGHEGTLMQGLESESIDEERDAIALLSSSELVIGIAPLTNIAKAVEVPGRAMRHAYLMSGDFGTDPGVEHNIRCDVAAAQVVFSSDLELTVVGLDQTQRVRIDGGTLDQIASVSDFGGLLSAEVRQFWRFINQASNVPHDPIAVLALLRPELFEFARGRISVDTAGAREGVTHFTPTDDGPHRIVVDMDVEAVSNQIVERILNSVHHSTIQLNEEKYE